MKRGRPKGNTSGRIARAVGDMRRQILQGKFKAGALLPPQRVLADEYGMSGSSAAAVMLRLAHEGLIERTPGRGSFVRKSLPQHRRTVDFLRQLDPPGIDALTDWVAPFTECCRQHQISAQWHHVSEAEAAQGDVILRRFSDSQVLVVLVRGDLKHLRLETLAARGTRVIAVHIREKNQLAPAPYLQVTWDRSEMVRLVGEHLLSLGHRAIVFIGGIGGWHTGAFIDFVNCHQLPIPANWLIQWDGRTPLPNLRHRLTTMFAGPNRPTVILCGTDRIAARMIDILWTLGYHAPQEVAVAACDDGPYGTAASVPITAVSFSMQELVMSVLDQIENTPEPASTPPLLEPIVLPVYLRVRESCGAKLNALNPISSVGV